MRSSRYLWEALESQSVAVLKFEQLEEAEKRLFGSLRSGFYVHSKCSEVSSALFSLVISLPDMDVKNA